MTWTDFYENYTEWSVSTIASRISALDDMGSGDEIVTVVLDLADETLKTKLIRKAIRENVRFTQDDFICLEGELPEDVYRELAAHTGFDADNPYLDEENLLWDDFYLYYGDWNEVDALRRIGKLKNFGPSDEVCEAICEMPTCECREALYQKAIAFGVKFTAEELEEMGIETLEDLMSVDEAISQAEQAVSDWCAELEESSAAIYPVRKKRGPGLLGLLIALGSALNKTAHNRNTAHLCNGDCDNCPAHYGYRYGRWYYGHGHQHGCVRRGNGGRFGYTYRN